MATVFRDRAQRRTMTGPDGGTLDPATLFENGGIDAAEETVAVDDEDDFRRHAARAGHVAVGVVDDGSVLLLTPDDGDTWMLPTAPVDADQSWSDVAHAAVAAQTEVPIAIDGPERVRRVRYERDGEATTNYVLVLRATPAEDPDDEDVPGVEWFEAVPETASGERGADVRQFF
jgi:hypothetical protein